MVVDIRNAILGRQKMPRIVEDITGQRFGKWIVLEKAENKRYGMTGETLYICKCDCGTVRNVRRYGLVNGDSKHCGCECRNNSAVIPYQAKKDQYLVERTDLSLLKSNKPANNTSGRRGVSYDAKREKWVAYISVNKKRHTLGYFANFEDAVKARELGEETYFLPLLERYRRAEDGK
jgi:hypothetical protein